MSRERLNVQVALWVWSSADVPAKDVNLGTVSVWVVLKANRPDEIHEGLGEDDVYLWRV